jgi:tetratricopeptide (TPR) repeat protein
MAKRPEDRWPTAAAMVQTLELALTESGGRRRASLTALPATAPIAAQRSTPPPLRLHRAGAASRVPRRGVAVAALAAAALGVGVAVGASHDSSSQKAHIAARTPHPAGANAAPAHHPAPHHKAPARHVRTHPNVTGTQAAATTPPPTADTLEARGHQLMLDGNYGAAIPILRQAVAAASPSSLTYAYALFDLGHSLRMSGDPRAAIPILYRRLQIPNQTEAVRAELQAALRAVGAQVNAAGGGAPAPAGPPGHDNGPGGPGKHKGHGPKD